MKNLNEIKQHLGEDVSDTEAAQVLIIYAMLGETPSKEGSLFIMDFIHKRIDHDQLKTLLATLK